MGVRKLLPLLLLIGLAACVEPYQFEIENKEPALVVEGWISDVSRLETRNYPAAGRNFSVKLSYTSDVTNSRSQAVSDASVQLISDQGDSWDYVPTEPGSYELLSDMKAEAGKQYKLRITLATDEVFESDWEALAEAEQPPMGEISFEETEKKMFVVESGERVVKTVKGINVYVELPQHDREEPLYYYWDFDPSWIYIAPLARSSTQGYKCWITESPYLSKYTLQQDNRGGYRKELFFLEVEHNERIFEELRILIRQQVVPEGYFYFLQEMQEQVSSEGLFDKPPFNLKTNFQAVQGDGQVFGYFAVVQEQAKRWKFDKEDLSYYVHNYLKEECLKPYGPPARGEIDPCRDCRGYLNGEATIYRPEWWLLN